MTTYFQWSLAEAGLLAECSKALAVSKVTVTDAVNFVYSANCDRVRGSLARKGG